MSENLEKQQDDVNTIEDLVKYSLEKDYNKANEIFGNVMTVKMNDVLDQTKAKLAGEIYNDVPPEDEEIDDEDLEDEEDDAEPVLREVKGRRGITDFRVVADETNNTPEVIDRNEFIASIFIKPARSINFITLNFVAVRTGVDFEEVVGTV